MMRRLVFLTILTTTAFTAGSLAPAHSLTRPDSCAHPTVLRGDTAGVAFADHYRVNNDDWTGAGKTTTTVCSPSDWTSVVNEHGMPASGVKTYPDSERTFTDWSTCASQPALSSFSTLTSSYAITAPAASASYDAAYDLFIGGGACAGPSIEVMVWNRWRHIDVPAAQPATIGGVAYDVFHSGSYIQVRQHKQSLHGTVDLLAILTYLKGQGLLSPAQTLLFVQYGFEVLTTRGRDLPFTLAGFSVTSAP